MSASAYQILRLKTTKSGSNDLYFKVKLIILNYKLIIKFNLWEIKDNDEHSHMHCMVFSVVAMSYDCGTFVDIKTNLI